MSRVILQVPMTKQLKEAAEKAARSHGFSSLQETIRVLLHKLSQKELNISFQEEKVERLSPKAEKRYAKMIADIKSGKEKTKSFESVDEMMEYLHSEA